MEGTTFTYNLDQRQSSKRFLNPVTLIPSYHYTYSYMTVKEDSNALNITSITTVPCTRLTKNLGCLKSS
jgi:hypothetical protein